MKVYKLCSLLTFLLASALPWSAQGQTSPPIDSTRQGAIHALVVQISTLQEKLTEKTKEIAASPSADQQKALFAELKDIDRQAEATKLELLEVIATDVDLSGLATVENRPFTVQSSLEELIKPLIEEVKKATANTREVQALRARFDAAKTRSEVIEKALASLEATIAISDDTEKPVLQSIREEFAGRFEEVRNEVSVLGYRLNGLDKEKHSFVNETKGYVASFFRERGRNLLLAFAVAALVFIGLRYFHLYLHNHTKLFAQGRTFPARLADVGLAIATALGAILGAILVFVIVGDWVLLGLIVLILIAVAFATKGAIPGMMTEAKLLMNLGPVREGERLIYEGVPWKVENLTFDTILKNPALNGDTMRLPIAKLHDLVSRPAEEGEPFFPCQKGDWVYLRDETYGFVVFQSLEMVQLKLLGGSIKSYSTPDFLRNSPRNNSLGFRVKTRFGIDHRHQADSTGSILETLNQFFQTEVSKLLETEKIKSMKVEFAHASLSSLEYEVLLDLDGSVAAKLFAIERALQRIAVDACNRFELEIPFQQITLHGNPPN